MVKITVAELAKLDVCEGHPSWYTRMPIKVFVHNGTPVPEGEDTQFYFDEATVESYIIQNHTVFVEPCDEYLEAISKTLYAYNVLVGRKEDKTVNFKVVNAITG